MEALDLITHRSSPGKLVDPAPSAADFQAMLAAAAAAPDHGRMKPWRFILIEGEGRERFGDLMVESLRRREPDAPQGKLEAERKKAMRAPAVVIVAAAVQSNPKIPEIEQIVAVGAATQNFLLAAHSLGYGGMWRTGNVSYDAGVKSALGLNESDTIVGILYVGSVGVPGQPRPADTTTVLSHWPA